MNTRTEMDKKIVNELFEKTYKRRSGAGSEENYGEMMKRSCVCHV
jgi:hypothetical protein